MNHKPAAAATAFEIFPPLQPGFAQHFDDYIEQPVHFPSSFPVLFYQFSIPMEHSGRCPVLPGGWLDILFPYGSNVSIPRVYGSISSRADLILQSGTTYFAARMFPASLAPFAFIPMKKLANRSVPLHEFLPSDRCPKIQSGTLSFSSRISAFQQEIKLLRSTSLPKTEKGAKELMLAIEQIYISRGNMNLIDLSEMLNCSTRHVRSVFEKFVGMPPKTFCQITRFQSAVAKLLQPRNNTYVDIISESGYYDQAHFIREFKKFSRECPTSWLTHLLHQS